MSIFSQNQDSSVQAVVLEVPDYTRSPSTMTDHLIAFLTGFAGAFLVLFIFYKIVLLALIGGAACGVIYIFVAAQSAVSRNKAALRRQFFDMLEALSVAMRAGNTDILALQSARTDLLLLYPEKSNIIVELSNIILKFQNNVPISESFSDFANRSGLEDIKSFASIYRTIEGKSSRSNEIIRQTQQIISDKMEIELEIETLMTAAKSEVNIMLAMPLVILGILGYLGSGFMDAIYTTPTGRLVATGGLIVFIICLLMARKFSSVKL